MKHRKNSLNFVDLFCGGGLGARGAYRSGARPVLAVDSWELATDTYLANFPQTRCITSPIELLDPSEILAGISADILLTSPECTSHSIARGAQPGTEKSRETAINILPWIKALNPRWVVVENVPRMKQWKRHIELKQSIEKLGYTISEMTLDASLFGAPQARKRLFMVCDKEGDPPIIDDLQRFAAAPKPASSIISHNGGWKKTKLFSKTRAANTLARAERAISELGRKKDFIIVYYGSDYAGGWQRLDVPLRTITTLDRFAIVTYESGTYWMRMLQPPELLAAMGAQEHKLPLGTRRDKVKLCGNGVCSTVMETVFKSIIAKQPK